MTVPSSIFELAQMEVLNARADLVGRLQGVLSLHYLMSKVLKLSDEEILLIMQQRQEESEFEANLQATSQSIMQKAVATAMMQGQAQGQIDATQMTNAAGMQTPDQQAQQAQAQQFQADQAQQAQQAQQATQQARRSEGIITGPLIKIRDGVRPREYYGLERRLFEGQAAPGSSEWKRIEEKLNRAGYTDRAMGEHLRSISNADRMMQGRMKELAGLIRELNVEVRGLRGPRD